MPTPKQSIIPPEGHHYVDTTTGTAVRIEGHSYEDVAEKVLRHRLQNRVPPGNALQDVYNYVCSTWPHFCTQDEASPRKSANLPEHISRRTATWTGAFARTTGVDRGVSQQEAERRAAICAACPKNVRYELGVSCQSCVATTNQLSFVYRHGRSTSQDVALQACDVTSQHNRTAVWSTQLPALSETESNQLPENCWRK